jgi:uncharacterized protein (DUF433 family)
MKWKLISSDPRIMGGTPVFRGTRVPVQTLIDYLEAGESISDFLEGFPTVTKEQVIAFLEEAKEKVLADFQNSPG